MDADNGRDNSLWLRADKKVVITRVIACANFRRGNPIWACAPTRFVHLPATYFLDVIRHVLLLQHPSDLDLVIISKNTNLSTSSMEYSSWHLLNRVTVASSAASAILNLSERRVDAVKSAYAVQMNLNNKKRNHVIM